MRLCSAKGSKAIFHRWSEFAHIIPPSPMVGGHPGGQIRYATAIVEYESGQITEVMPNDVIFRDTADIIQGLAEKLGIDSYKIKTEEPAEAKAVSLLEAAAEEIENCYDRETELTEKIRLFLSGNTESDG